MAVKFIKMIMIGIAVGSGINGVATEYRAVNEARAMAEQAEQLEVREQELKILIEKKQLELELELAVLFTNSDTMETVEL